ncbi:hypothetical protein CK203_047924 [Vitis vinifera]|uniref:Uncharacterized protein n=1 Tax=Vitis vinifera TaxID=29760 RepID=A0A438GRA2_VITVI|nr:hypothetical protein CK203_047924 [Vitis vinifera]
MCRDYDGKVTPEEVAAAALYLKDTLGKEGIQELISNLSKDKDRKQGGVGVRFVLSSMISGLRTQKLLPDPCILLTALCPEFGSPSADAALLVEADGFVGLGLSFAFVLGGRYLTLFPSSSPKTEVLHWQGILSNGGSRLRSFSEDVGGKDVESEENFLDSYKNFVSFSEYLGLPLEGFEKEVDSLLRKLEAWKGRRVVGSRGKRRSSPASQFERELQRALGGDGRWRGKGCFQSLPCALGFHSGQLPCFAWNCGFGSQAAAWFGWSCTQLFRAWFCRFGSPLAWVVMGRFMLKTLSDWAAEMKMPIHLKRGECRG